MTQATSSSDQYLCLTEILTCLVCSNLVSNAHICPNCSKFYCLPCITSHLTQQDQCPNCHSTLQQQMLVNCQKLCLQLSNKLQSLKGDRNLSNDHLQVSCKKHHNQNKYYCNSCHQAVCEDCIIVAEQHENHSIIKLETAKTRFVEQMMAILSKLDSIKQNTKNDWNSRKVQGEKRYESIKTIDKKIKQMVNQTIKLKSSITNNFKINEEVYANNSIFFKATYEQSLSELNNTSKSFFISQKYQQMQHHLTQISSQIKQQNLQLSHIKNDIFAQESTLQSPIFPSCESTTFTIWDFSQIKEQSEYIYTEQFVSSYGLTWRLKIYPTGEKQEEAQIMTKPKLIRRSSAKSLKQEEYLSVFIELLKGPTSGTTQKHTIAIKNHNKTKQCLRQFENEFTINQCCGYQQFIKVSSLYDDEYIHPLDDCLQIEFQIRPSSYQQACLDQEWLIKMLDNTKVKNDKKIAKMKRRDRRSHKSLVSTKESISSFGLIN